MLWFHRLNAAAAVWRRRDRGDSPVPSSILIAGLALLAFGVVAFAWSIANGIMEQVPTELPTLP